MTHTREPIRDDDADVGRLLRLAGQRPAVPAERLERVRGVARAQWERAVARRRRARWLWSAAALVPVACLAAWFLVGRVARPEIVVEAFQGSARSGTRGIEVGSRVASGSEVTTAADGRVALRLPSGHSVRLDTSTTLRVLGARSLELARGAIYVDSGFRQTAAAALEIETPFGSIRETGTQFEVRLAADSLAVRLREGAARLMRGGEALDVRAGNELIVGAGGTFVRRAIPTHGADWDWAAGIAPMLALEGRSLHEFLEWVARERGLALTFADEAAARSASEVVLSGVARRMNLDEALDAVLTASRMSHRVEGGALIVSQLRPVLGP